MNLEKTNLNDINPEKLPPSGAWQAVCTKPGTVFTEGN